MICYLIFDIDDTGLNNGQAIQDIQADFPSYSMGFYGDEVLIKVDVEEGWLDDKSWKDDVNQVIESREDYLTYVTTNANESAGFPPQWITDLQASHPWLF